ncbi:hypothetical protein ARMSODRAFT_320394 [Armillaria solidipes]|uniref:Uncharacterized protein n=1 Tax=Armillaria solidipes TaxID=1076256 RepID=A0A2H3B8F1_9AGAR|nr:hypothetical protein ARMSODRAFT_320394 [Armillaria solidipes]
MEERAAKAQASVDNAHTVSHNSHLQYPYLYLSLKKTVRFFFSVVLCLSASYLDQKISGTGIDKAKEVRPDNIAEDALASETASIGTLPQGFKGQISKYSGMEILEMIIFYNDNFKIVRGDDLPVRIDKFRSYLSEFAEIAEE